MTILLNIVHRQQHELLVDEAALDGKVLGHRPSLLGGPGLLLAVVHVVQGGVTLHLLWVVLQQEHGLIIDHEVHGLSDNDHSGVGAGAQSIQPLLRNDNSGSAPSETIDQ